MFYKIDIKIGEVTISRLHPYKHDGDKAETFDRTLDESLFVNRRVNSENQLIKKYHFEFLVVEGDNLDDVRSLAECVGNHNYIDYYEIVERFSSDGATNQWTLRRPLASASYLPKIIVDDVEQTVTINELTNPAVGNVYVNQATGVMSFGSTPTDANDNVEIFYVPVFPVHIASCKPEKREKGIEFYKVICDEV